MKNKLYFIIPLLVLFFGSCEDDYLEKYPLDSPSDATFWSTQSELELAINAIYTSLYFTDRTATHVPFQFLFDFTTDIGWDRNLSVWRLISQGQITPAEESLIYGAWSNAYATIGHCNRLLANMDRAIDNTDPQVYQRIAAEARFFRAYWYHLLIELYGDVPFTDQPLDVFDAQLPREDRYFIYQFVLDELTDVAEILPEEYEEQDRGRVTKAAALALKARVALYNSDWAVAEASAKAVMDMNKYELYPDYQTLFTYEAENNAEEILTIHFSRANQLTHETPVHTRGRLTGGFATKIPTQALLDAYECTDGLRIDQSPLFNPEKPFENRDPRLQATCVLPGSVFLGYQFETHPDSLEVWDYNSNPPRRVTNLEVTHAYATFSGYQFRKYVEADDREFRRQSELDIMLIRYAEVLLIYAEAVAEQGQMTGEAIAAINAVRARVNMPPVQPSSIDEFRAAIRHERKVEFAYEGLRFFDIRRWKIAEHVMPGILHGRPLQGFEASFIPEFDEFGSPHYDAYGDKLRQFDTRYFDVSRDYLWPVPQKELDINENLTQNPGY